MSDEKPLKEVTLWGQKVVVQDEPRPEDPKLTRNDKGEVFVQSTVRMPAPSWVCIPQN